MITLVGTGVLDCPLQTVRIAENFVKWTVEDAGPYNFCTVCGDPLDGRLAPPVCDTTFDLLQRR